MAAASATANVNRASNWRQTVFDTVDEAYFSRGSMPPGTVGRMFRALDVMRADSAEAAIIERAEAIAIGLHRLLLAMQSAPGDDLAVTPIRHELRMMGVDWLKAMPLHH